MCDMTHLYVYCHSWVWHDSTTSSCSLSVWRDSLIRVTCLTSTCAVTHSWVWRHVTTSPRPQLCVTWLMYTCAMPHSYVWYEPFICVSWRSYVCHDSLLCMTWLLYRTWLGCVDISSLCMPWRIYIYAMTHSYLCHDLFLLVRWLTDWLWILRWVGSLKLQVIFAEYRLFYRALLQKRPIISRSLLIVATPYIAASERERKREQEMQCTCSYQVWGGYH